MRDFVKKYLAPSCVATIVAAVITIAPSVFSADKKTPDPEKEKMVRAELRSAYEMTRAFPDYALAVNYAATAPMTKENYQLVGAQYNDRLLKLHKLMDDITQVGRLYDPSVIGATEQLQSCTKNFSVAAANHLLLQTAATIDPHLVFPTAPYAPSEAEITQSINRLAMLRVSCEEASKTAQVALAKAMQAHI